MLVSGTVLVKSLSTELAILVRSFGILPKVPVGVLYTAGVVGGHISAVFGDHHCCMFFFSVQFVPPQWKALDFCCVLKLVSLFLRERGTAVRAT